MEGMEAKVNISQIKKEFESELLNAENQNQDSQTNVAHVVPAKLKLNVPKVAAKLVCDIKNSIEAKILTKDLDDDAKKFVRDYLKTTDKEVELYRLVLEQVGTDFTPENYKDFLNRWLCSPIVLLIEHELEKLLTLKNLLKEFKATQPKAEVA